MKTISIEKENKKKIAIIFIVSMILTTIDLVTKSLFTNKQFFKDSIVSIIYSQNYGSSFGIFSNLSYYSYSIAAISIITLLGSFLIYKHFLKDKYLIATYTFFIAGVLGNTYDRIIFGFVRDFISLKHLFIFNIADFYFTLAFATYLTYEWRKIKK